MKAKSGTKIGEPFGIGVYIHWSFWLLVGYIALKYAGLGGIGGMLNGVAFIFGVFGCVVLHELGHSLAARRYGIGTRDITLYPIGGVASLESMPRKPVQELVIALAGPAVNVVIAVVLGLLLSLGIQDRLLVNLFYTNIALVLFNLLPAFPMDGGRVLRAGLSMLMPRERATSVAATTGKVFAVIMGLVGLFSNPMLVLIAVFVWMAASAEQRVVRAEAAYESMFGFSQPPPPGPSAPPPPMPKRPVYNGEREVVEPEVLPPGHAGPGDRWVMR